MALHEDIWAERALDVAVTALLVIHNFACPNPCFNLLHSTRQAATNTVLGGPFTYAAGDKEYAKAQFLTRKGDREQFRRGNTPPVSQHLLTSLTRALCSCTLFFGDPFINMVIQGAIRRRLFGTEDVTIDLLRDRLCWKVSDSAGRLLRALLQTQSKVFSSPLSFSSALFFPLL